MKSFLQSWLDAVFQHDPALASFNRETHDQLLAEFRRCDLGWQRQNAGRIIQEIGKSPPGAAVCILANPQGVSASLPEFLGFDLVLFAEASQILTEEALPAICRGRQIIVSGDDRQPGPSETQGAFMPESLLDACTRAGLPRLTLRETYNNRHESLMAFANAHLYGNHLSIFSAPFKSHSELGVKFYHVPDGVLDNGQNVREVSVVADLVLAQLGATPQKSLGVIAFDLAHQAAIADEIDRRKADLKKLGQEKAEPFCVKDARSVDGADRDVIVLSIGYARDRQGILSGSLEPLDQEEGTRLINAAITRARQKLIVVSSLRAGDMNPALYTAEGVVLLRQFLEFAETGSLGSEERVAEPGALELDIIREMKTRGFVVQTLPGEGAIRPDLAVVDPADSSRYVLGIVLDGPPLFAVATTRERDRLRHEELLRLGWNLHTLWAPAWAFNRKEEIERLVKGIPSSRQTANAASQSI